MHLCDSTEKTLNTTVRPCQKRKEEIRSDQPPQVTNPFCRNNNCRSNRGI
jgi:hypothetical protein